MGREVRRVPENWKHPSKRDVYGEGYPDDEYQPMYAETYAEAAERWKREYEAWKTKPKADYDFWLYDSPPDEEHYYQGDITERPWFQVYETVSEGTPVTPPFATEEELARYLSQYGDFWDQRRRAEGRYLPPLPTYERALAFVKSGYAPSFMISAAGIQGPYQMDHGK